MITVLAALLTGCSGRPTPPVQDTGEDTAIDTGGLNLPRFSEYADVVWTGPGAITEAALLWAEGGCTPCVMAAYGVYLDNEWGLPGTGFVLLGREGQVRQFQADPLDKLTTSPAGDCGGGFAVGDVDGDSVEDLVCSGPGGPTWLLPGPLRLDAGRSFVAGDIAPPLSAPVGGQFVDCDLNADGQADLCSAIGIAIGPVGPSEPPSSDFLDPRREDRLLRLDGPASKLLLYQSFSQQLMVLDPATLSAHIGNPITRAELAEYTADVPGLLGGLEMYTTPTGDSWVLASLAVEPGPHFELRAWRADTLQPVFTLNPGFSAAQATEVTVGDFDLDGVFDIAIAADHRVGVAMGPVDSDTNIELVWRYDPVARGGTIGRHLTANGSDLWLATSDAQEVWLLPNPHLPPGSR